MALLKAKYDENKAAVAAAADEKEEAQLKKATATCTRVIVGS